MGMTEQEIKDYIVNLCKDSECRYLTEDNECIEAGICFEVKETCVKALNKQIAKKPIFDDEQSFIRRYHCPECKCVVDAQRYCHHCGQKLDFEEE